MPIITEKEFAAHQLYQLLKQAIEIHAILNPHHENSERQPEQNQQWLWESRQATLRQIFHDVEAFGDEAYAVDKPVEEEKE